MSAKANATPIFKWRIIVVTALLAGLFGMLVLRLVQLQVGAVNMGLTSYSAKVIFVLCDLRKFQLTGD